MKKIKLLGVLTTVLIGGGLFGLAEKASADDYYDDYWDYVDEYVSGQYIQMPAKDLRYVVSGHHSWMNLDKSDLFKNYGLIDPLHALEFDGLGSEEVFYIESLEGIDQFTNLTSFGIDGLQGVTDFRPLSKLTKMEYLDLRLARIDNLDFVKGMTDLQSLYIETDGNRVSSDYIQSKAAAEKYYKYGLPGKSILQDLTPLSGLAELDEIHIEMYNGEFAPITMKNGYRKYEVFDPITLSSQFDGTTIEYSSPDANFTNTDGLLKWNSVPYGTESLRLAWTAESDGAIYKGSATIPINWR